MESPFEEGGSDDNAESWRRRLDAEWLTLNVIREMLGIAVKDRLNPTYQQAMDFGRVIAPDLFEHDNTLIMQPPEKQL